ncbi:hypothetical protein [Symbioplanes lichenis]|uniref:hypothetical protein n=1 Tax=Symbioplanes lichenis TaxID=1629072 RepID=UPI00273A073A|nr:hypothetical protein [Actinoplanes lichenis]
MTGHAAFGRRATFAIEVGGPPAYVVEAGATEATSVREVDVWADGRRLTCHDNAAYVPTLVPQLRSAADLVRQRAVPACPFPGRSPAEVFDCLSANDTGFAQRFWLLRHWDEILDNVETYAWLGDQLVITGRIRQPAQPDVFVAPVDPAEFVATLDEAVALLAG